MQQPILMALLAALISLPASLAGAQQPTPVPTIKVVPIKPTSPVSGEQMYATYCASCHGAKGIGNGPAAPAMKVVPTNLTTLSKKNGGTFPAEHIQTILKFGVESPAHGSAEMPIWGDLLRTLTPGSANSSVVVNQRIANLTNYIKQIQQ